MSRARLLAARRRAGCRWRAAWLAVGLAVLVGCSDAGARAPRPNVVFISIDSLRADHLGCYGYERPTSPHIDRLAGEGVLFETVVAESSWTLPSHASMLTGVTEGVHGVGYRHQRLAPGWATLPTILAEEGYRTRGFYSGPYLHPVFGLAQGYAEGDYEGILGAIGQDDVTSDLDASHRASHASVTSPELAAAAVRFLEEAGEQPFFLFLHFFDVHYDYVPPEEDWRVFDPTYAGELTSHDFKRNEAIHRDMDPRDLEHLLALYDGEILFTDRHVGRVLDALQRLELADDTLVVLTSDHGDEFFEHGHKGHFQSLYDEVLLVPLVLRLPGRLPAGRRVDAQVRHIDVLPTILDLLGVPAPEAAMGRSLLAYLREGSKARDLPAVSRVVGAEQVELSSLRTGDSKLIVWRHEGEQQDLRYYDLLDDPGEKRVLKSQADRSRLSSAFRQLQRLTEREDGHRARHAPADGDDVTLPAEVEAQLRELGYIR